MLPRSGKFSILAESWSYTLKQGYMYIKMQSKISVYIPIHMQSTCESAFIHHENRLFTNTKISVYIPIPPYINPYPIHQLIHQSYI